MQHSEHPVPCVLPSTSRTIVPTLPSIATLLNATFNGRSFTSNFLEYPGSIESGVLGEERCHVPTARRMGQMAQRNFSLYSTPPLQIDMGTPPLLNKVVLPAAHPLKRILPRPNMTLLQPLQRHEVPQKSHMRSVPYEPLNRPSPSSMDHLRDKSIGVAKEPNIALNGIGLTLSIIDKNISNKKQLDLKTSNDMERNCRDIKANIDALKRIINERLDSARRQQSSVKPNKRPLEPSVHDQFSLLHFRQSKRMCFSTASEAAAYERQRDRKKCLLSMYRDRENSADVLFKFPGDQKTICVKAHRSVLEESGAHSVTMLTGAFPKTTSNRARKKVVHVQFESLTPQILEKILRYLYTGSVKIHHFEEWFDLLVCADHYLLEELQKSCLSLLYQSLCLENAWEFLETANQKRCLSAQQILCNYIASNATALLINNPPLSRLSADNFIKIIQEDLLDLEEGQVAQVVYNWLQSKALPHPDRKDRENPLRDRKDIDELREKVVSYVRLPLINREELYQKWLQMKICGYSLFKEQDIHNAALTYRRTVTPKRKLFDRLDNIVIELPSISSDAKPQRIDAKPQLLEVSICESFFHSKDSNSRDHSQLNKYVELEVDNQGDFWLNKDSTDSWSNKPSILFQFRFKSNDKVVNYVNIPFVYECDKQLIMKTSEISFMLRLYGHKLDRQLVIYRFLG